MEMLVNSCPAYGNIVSDNCIRYGCVCPTCLSRHRSLYPLNEHQRDLMVVLGIFKIKNIQKICWECYAMVKNITRFKHTAIQAQKLLLERDLVVLNAVGNLSKLKKTESIKILSILEKDNEIQQTTDFKIMKPDLLAISLTLEEPIITTVKQNQSTAQVQIAPKSVTITERQPRFRDPDHAGLKLDHNKILTEQSHNSESTNNKLFVSTVLEKQSVRILGNKDVTAQSTSQSTFNYLKTSKADTFSIEDFTVKPISIATVRISDALLETSETSRDVKFSKTADTLEDFAVDIQGVTTKGTSDFTTLKTSESLPNDVITFNATDTQSIITTETSTAITQEAMKSSFNDVIISTIEESSFEESAKITEGVNIKGILDVTLQTSEPSLYDVKVSKTGETLLEDSAAITRSVAKIERFTTQRMILNDLNISKAHDTPLEESVSNTCSSAIETSDIITQEIMLNDINISKAPETLLKDSAAITHIVPNVKKTDITQKVVLNDIYTSKPPVTPLEDPAVITNDVTALGIFEVIKPKSSITKPVTSDSKVMNVKNYKSAETSLIDLVISVDKLTLHSDDETPCQISTEKNTDAMDNQVKNFVEAPVNSDDLTAKVLNVFECVSDGPSKANSNVFESENSPDILMCTEELIDSPEEIDESYITHLEQNQPNQKQLTVIQKLKKVSNNLMCHQKNVKSRNIGNLKCLENNINTIVKQQIQKENYTKRRKTKFDNTTELNVKDYMFASTPNRSDNSNPNKQNLNLHEKNIKKQQQLVVNRITADSSWNLISHDIKAKLTEHDKNKHRINSKRRVSKTKEIINKLDTAIAFKNAIFDHNYSKNSLSLYEIACSKLCYMNENNIRYKGKKKKYEHNNMKEVAQKTLDSIDKQNETTIDVLCDDQLEINIIDDWDMELQNANADDKQRTKNEQIKTKNNQVQKDVLSIDTSAVQTSTETITNKRVDLNTRNKTHKEITLITDIKVEKCYPEYVEQSHESNHNLNWTENRCKIEQEEIHIKPEPFFCDAEDNFRNTASEKDTSSETDYLENEHCESALSNYYNVGPTETDPSKLSYYDYQYKPLDHSEHSPVDNDKSGLKNESNITNNPNVVPTDFEMSNITVWFSSVQFNDTSTTTECENVDSPNSIPAATDSGNVLNTTEDLLEPIYYTSWTDETYEHHSKVINDSTKNTRKRVSDQEKAVVKSIKIEKDNNIEVKGQRLSERIRNKKLDLTRKQKDCVECECNQNKLRNRSKRFNKNPHVTNNDKTMLHETNYEKLFLHPTVLLNKIETVLDNEHDNNHTLVKIKDEPPEEHEGVIVTPDKINIKVEPLENEVCNESTTDLVQDAIKKTEFDDQPLNLNETKKLRTREVNLNVPINPNKRKRRSRQETTMYTIRYLRDGEFETLKAKIINGSKFQAAKFKCFKCLRKFTEKGFLEVHLKCHQASTGSVKCEKCERRFKDEKKLKVHAAIHERCVQCQWCPKEYLIVEDYKEHVKISHPAEYTARNERLYTCEICHKGHRNYSSLRYHKNKVHFAIKSDVSENFADNNSRCAPNNSSLVENNSSLTGNNSSLTGNNSSLTGNNSSLTGNNLSVTGSNLNFREKYKNTCAVCDKIFRSTFACKRHFKAAQASQETISIAQLK